MAFTSGVVISKPFHKSPLSRTKWFLNIIYVAHVRYCLFKKKILTRKDMKLARKVAQRRLPSLSPSEDSSASLHYFRGRHVTVITSRGLVPLTEQTCFLSSLYNSEVGGQCIRTIKEMLSLLLMRVNIFHSLI